MATVYKVEIEVVSDRINYTPEDMVMMIRQLIEIGYVVNGNNLQISEIKAERTS